MSTPELISPKSPSPDSACNSVTAPVTSGPHTASFPFESCFVRVLRIDNRTGKAGQYKTVKVKQELSFWFRTFRFNIFPGSPMYDTIREDMQLDVKVEHFSRFYKNLINARECEYEVCETCFKYIGRTEKCLCDGEAARHIIGPWELVKIMKTPKASRLYFEQDGQKFCHCVFSSSPEDIGLKEKTFYYLEGWQREATRHNCIIIYESQTLPL